jgi:hypothetical protein
VRTFPTLRTDRYRFIRRRQTIEDLLLLEQI